MPTNYQQRLARLRQLAETHTTQSYGRGDIEELLEQPTNDPEAIECPRYVAITEHADERTLFCDDSPRELLATLSELASSEIRERPEAIIDLDTNTRHEATNTVVITFAPDLPDEGTLQPVALGPGERGALRLLLDVAEEHQEGNREVREAIQSGERLLARALRTGA
jgi:hypothetical protein